MEILIILLVAFLVLGPDKAVKFGKTLGTITRKLKRTSEEFTAGLTKEIEIQEEQEKRQPLEKSGPTAPVNQGKRGSNNFCAVLITSTFDLLKLARKL